MRGRKQDDVGSAAVESSRFAMNIQFARFVREGRETPRRADLQVTATKINPAEPAETMSQPIRVKSPTMSGEMMRTPGSHPPHPYDLPFV